MAAYVVLALGIEVVAASLQPMTTWIATVQVAIAVVGLSGVFFIARSRVPKAVRSVGSTLKLTGRCLSANHDGCGQHLTCPCHCHDHYISDLMVMPTRVIDPTELPSGA